MRFSTRISVPNGIDVTNRSDMIIVDTNGPVHRYDKRGILLGKISNVERPYDVVPLPDGRVVVSEIDASRVTTRSGEKIIVEKTIPKCRGLAVNSKNKIAVVCNNPPSVLIMKLDLTVINTIQQYKGQNIFSGPCYIAFTSQDNIVVSDHSNHNITVLSPDGVPLYKYGSNCGFHKPQGVCIDDYDNIIIADNRNHRIHLLSSDGKFVKYILTDQDGLMYPQALAINDEGDLLVTQHWGDVKVYKYLE